MSAVTAPSLVPPRRRNTSIAAPSRSGARSWPAGRSGSVSQRGRVGAAGHLLVMALIAGAGIFGVVALNAMSAATAVETRALEARVAANERHYGQLVAEVSTLADPGRIRALAREQGMVDAGPTRYVQVRRTLPGDGAVGASDESGIAADPIKPILSMER